MKNYINIFDDKIVRQLNYYVYALVDPFNNKPFYIGKGKGNRIFEHINQTLLSPSEHEKYTYINSIHEHGGQVQHFILRSNIKTSDEALVIESTLIDFCKIFSPQLELNISNIVYGHNSDINGIMTSEELIRLFGATTLENIEEGCLIININKNYYRTMDSNSCYEATRSSWVIARQKLSSIKYVLSEYRGIIIEVFEVEQDNWEQDTNDNKRYSFIGKIANEEIRQKYINKKVKKLKGEANPIKYWQAYNKPNIK